MKKPKTSIDRCMENVFLAAASRLNRKYLHLEPYTDVHIHCCSISHHSDSYYQGNTSQHTVLLRGVHLDTRLAFLLDKHVIEKPDH